MKDTNKTMDNLLDTCKLFAATILVAVLLLTFALFKKAGKRLSHPDDSPPHSRQPSR